MLGALIGAGASIAGSLLGNRGGSNEGPIRAARAQAASYRQTKQINKRARKFAARQNKADRKFARSEAKRNQQNVIRSQQYSVRDRVADAKAAGLHPLFALGAAGSETGSPITVGGQSPTGGAMGALYDPGEPEGPSTFSRGLSAVGREVTNYQQRQLLARQEARANTESAARVTRDLAEAQYLSSRAKTAEAEANYGPLRTAAVAPLEKVPGAPLPPAGISQKTIPQEVSAPYNLARHAKGLHSRVYTEDTMGEIAPLFNILSQYLMSIGEYGRLRRHSRQFQPKWKSKARTHYYRNYGRTK